MRITILFYFLTAILFAGEIEWADSYSDAVEQAKKENKFVYVLITSETCRWCRKLEATTLEDDEVIAAVDANFVAVNVTRNKDDYPKYLKAKMMPMTYFMRTNGRVAHSVPGYWVEDDYISIIGDAVRKLKKNRKKK